MNPTEAAGERMGERVLGANVLAVVLGRAGSEGVRGKNTMPIAGKPCAAWTIEAALSAERVTDVVVSSDCPRLRELAHERGVRFVSRPAELAGSAATVDAAARHAAAAVDACGRYEAVVVLYANVPVRPGWLIDRAVEELVRTGADSVQSYEPVGKHHPWWTARLDADSGSVEAWDGGELNHGVYRRQELPAAYVPSGGVIAVRRAALMLELEGIDETTHGPHAFFGRDRRGVVHAAGEVVDIDEAIDAVVADAVLRAKACEGGVTGEAA